MKTNYKFFNDEHASVACEKPKNNRGCIWHTPLKRPCADGRRTLSIAGRRPMERGGAAFCQNALADEKPRRAAWGGGLRRILKI